MPKVIIACEGPRVGSSLLVSSLAAHPSLSRNADECFNERVPSSVSQVRLEYPDLTELAHGEALYATHDLFKIFKYSGEPSCSYLLKRCTVIYLYREDKEAQLNSLRKACTTGIWSAESSSIVRMSFSHQDFETYVTQARLALKPFAELVISYEQLTTDWHFTLRSIQEASNLQIMDLPPARKKMS